MQPALGELIFAEIDDGVALAAEAVGQPLLRPGGDVAVERLQQLLQSQQRLVGQRATGEEAAHITTGDISRNAGFWRRGLLREAGGQLSGVFQTGGEVEVSQAAGRRRITQVADDDRLLRVQRRAQHLPGHSRVGWLRDEHDDLCLRVTAEQVQRLQCGNAADFSLQVASAGAERLGDAAALVVDGDGDRLQARAGGGDQADGPATHPVCKAEANAVDDRSAAVRPHEQQPFLARFLLESHLVVQGNVVAVKEDVFAQLQRFFGHGGGIAAGHADQHPAGSRELLRGRGQATRVEALRRAGRTPPA